MILTALLTVLPIAAPTGDWPQYLGPDKSGVAPWAADTFTWPATDPTVAWRVPTGPGYGGVAIEGGEVFLFDHVKDERDELRVFDLASGEELWSAGYEQKGRLNFDGSRTVPTVAGRRVLTTSGFGPVTCFDRDTKKVAWSVDLEEDLGGRPPMFGWSGHPVLVDDTVVTTPLGPDIGLAALSLKDGSVAWKTGHIGFSHSTPVLVDFQGKSQLIFNACPDSASGQDKAMPATIWSFVPTSGETLWRHDLTLFRLPIPPPLVLDANRLFLTGGYRAGSVMLNVEDGDDGAVSVEETFRGTRGAQIHAPIRYGDHLYVLVNENWTEGRRNKAEGGLACLDLDGKELWRTGEDPNFGRGGIVRVADALLIQDGTSGEIVAVRATPKGYEELGRVGVFEPVRRGQYWAPPAISGTRMLIRGQDELICVELNPEL